MTASEIAVALACDRHASEWRHHASIALAALASSSWILDTSEPFDPWGSAEHMLASWGDEVGVRRAFALAAAVVVAVHVARYNGQPVAILDLTGGTDASE